MRSHLRWFLDVILIRVGVSRRPVQSVSMAFKPAPLHAIIKSLNVAARSANRKWRRDQPLPKTSDLFNAVSAR